MLAGELEATFRGVKSVVRAGETINIPSNAPHQLYNPSNEPVRLLCICSPAGQENFFMEVGVPGDADKRASQAGRRRSGRVQSESRSSRSKIPDRTAATRLTVRSGHRMAVTFRGAR